MIINANGGVTAEYVSELISSGGVSKIGTQTVGNPTTTPIYLSAGVPTAMTKTMVNVEDAQSITGVKTFDSGIVVKDDINMNIGSESVSTISIVSDADGSRKFRLTLKGSDGTTTAEIDLITVSSTGEISYPWD